jgi:hypothetical protein
MMICVIATIQVEFRREVEQLVESLALHILQPAT